jgi:hypothetical protein
MNTGKATKAESRVGRQANLPEEPLALSKGRERHKG